MAPDLVAVLHEQVLTLAAVYPVSGIAVQFALSAAPVWTWCGHREADLDVLAK